MYDFKLLPLHMTFGFIDFSSGTEVNFASVHQSFAERWVRVNRLGQVAGLTAHLDGQYGFSDQFTCSSADDTAAKYPMSGWIDQPLGQTVRTAERLSATTGRPWIDFNVYRSAFAFGLFFSQTGPGDLGIGEDTTAGIAAFSNTTGSPKMTSIATLASWDALCASIGSPATSPIAKMCGSAVRCCVVDDRKATLVQLHLSILEPDAGGYRSATNADQHAVETFVAVLARDLRT